MAVLSNKLAICISFVCVFQFGCLTKAFAGSRTTKLHCTGCDFAIFRRYMDHLTCAHLYIDSVTSMLNLLCCVSSG